MYLGSKKVAVTNTIEKQVPSMRAFFEAGGKCAYSIATSFDGCWQYDDTANLKDVSRYFHSNYNVVEIPPMNTSSATDMSLMFYNCLTLKKVGKMDANKVTNFNKTFDSCPNLLEIHIININSNLDISSSTKFTREALLEIIGNLKSQTSGTKTLTMGSTNLAKLTDEDKAIATNKGWTLA